MWLEMNAKSGSAAVRPLACSLLRLLVLFSVIFFLLRGTANVLDRARLFPACAI